MKVAIYNDCYLPQRPHFGCQLVMETFKEQLDRVGIELVGTVKLTDKEPRNALLDKADLVIVNGEGSFHHDRRRDISDISKYYNAILINTVFEKNTTSTKAFKYVSARESISAKNLKCDLVPDIIYTSKRLNNLPKGTGTKHKDIRHNGGLKTLQPADSFLDGLVECKSVSSESFHGIIAANLLGIEVTEVLPGSGVRWKTESQFSDINSREDYIDWAKNKINKMFESLHDI